MSMDASDDGYARGRTDVGTDCIEVNVNIDILIINTLRRLNL